MEILFSDKTVRDLCCSKAQLQRRFGVDLAKRICCRLSVLKGTPTLAQVPTVPPIGLMLLGADRTYSVRLGFGQELVFRACGSGDPNTIKEIEIIGPAPAPATRGKKK